MLVSFTSKQNMPLYDILNSNMPSCADHSFLSTKPQVDGAGAGTLESCRIAKGLKRVIGVSAERLHGILLPYSNSHLTQMTHRLLGNSIRNGFNI